MIVQYVIPILLEETKDLKELDKEINNIFDILNNFSKPKNVP